MGLFSTTKKRSVSKDVRTPKAPKAPKVTGTKNSWDNYAKKLADYNKKVEAVNKEKNRREALKNAKVKIDDKKK